MISIVFIINPISGGRNKKVIERSIGRSFSDKVYRSKILYTLFPGHAFDLALSEMKLGADIIVAVGGDGTINEIGRAVMFSETRLAIIPVGSGNGFARHYNIPLSINRAIQKILNGKEIYSDVGFINGKAFFCTSGIGFDAELAMVFNQMKTRGFLSYLYSFIKVYTNYHPVKYKIVFDDEEFENEAFFINIANISGFGYHFKIAPGASTSDGYLNLVIVQNFPKWKGIFLAFYSFLGIIDKSKYVFHKKVKNVKIKIRNKVNTIHIDGDSDSVSETEFEYIVKNKALRLII